MSALFLAYAANAGGSARAHADGRWLTVNREPPSISLDGKPS